MSHIVVWGVDHGKCLPMAGTGFRESFDTMQDADRFIDLQCNKVNREKLSMYAMYITNDICSIDRLMHHHNWRGSDTMYQDVDLQVEAVDIEERKNAIDIAYEAHKRRQDTKKLKIMEEVNHMTADDIEEQRRLFTETGLIGDNK